MLIVLNGVSPDPSAAAASADAYSRAFDRMMFRCLSTHRSRPTKARPSRTTHRVSAPMTSCIARHATPRDGRRATRTGRFDASTSGGGRSSTDVLVHRVGRRRGEASPRDGTGTGGRARRVEKMKNRDVRARPFRRCGGTRDVFEKR